MSAPENASAPPAGAAIIGEFWIHFVDIQPRSPLSRADRLVIEGGQAGGRIVIYRSGRAEYTLSILDATGRWGHASGDGIDIEYTRNLSPGRPNLIYGRFTQVGPKGGNEDPPTGVWGADSQPPRGGEENS